MIASGLQNFIRIVCWIFLISFFRRLLIMFLFIFKVVLGPMSGTEFFATLQIELYCVVDYDSKWSTKFGKGCMLGFKKNSLIRSHLIYIFFLIFKIVLGPMSGTELLQHSKLNLPCSGL